MSTVKKHKFLYYGINDTKVYTAQLDELAKEGWELVFVNTVNNTVLFTLQKTEFTNK